MENHQSVEINVTKHHKYNRTITRFILRFIFIVWFGFINEEVKSFMANYQVLFFLFGFSWKAAFNKIFETIIGKWGIGDVECQQIKGGCIAKEIQTNDVFHVFDFFSIHISSMPLKEYQMPLCLWIFNARPGPNCEGKYFVIWYFYKADVICEFYIFLVLKLRMVYTI